MIDYAKILSANYVGAQWTLDGNSYDGLTWLDTTKKPTKAELDAQWASVQTAIAKIATDKAAARQAVLDRLSITADEAQLLLG